MKIVKDYPPNIDRIRKTFPLSGSEIFTYGDTVYVPSGVPLTPELEAHEQVHINQQGNQPDVWWEKYFFDPQFRLDQEIEAHRAEYKKFCSLNKDKNQQARFLNSIAMRLASPMYGNIITHSQAIKMIK